MVHRDQTGCCFSAVGRSDLVIPMPTFFPLQADAFVKDKGLSDSLLLGCRVVLKERKVVLGLMSKCNTISSKMVRQVTEVMESGTGTLKQPALLNSQ